MLRSIRFGEADRVLHLYSADRGRIGAVAKGVRRVKSRLGGRLEPLSRVRLVLHEGRGDLCTVTAVDTRARPRRRCASTVPRWSAPPQACEAVLRLFDSAEPNRAAYNLLCNQLALLDADPAVRHPGPVAGLPRQAAAGRRLRARAGLLRHLRRGRAPVPASRPRPAAWSARAARPARSRWRPKPTSSWSRRWPARWRTHPPRTERALAQADRALAETLEHHAHVRLRRVA